MRFYLCRTGGISTLIGGMKAIYSRWKRGVLTWRSRGQCIPSRGILAGVLEMKEEGRRPDVSTDRGRGGGGGGGHPLLERGVYWWRLKRGVLMWRGRGIHWWLWMNRVSTVGVSSTVYRWLWIKW